MARPHPDRSQPGPHDGTEERPGPPAVPTVDQLSADPALAGDVRRLIERFAAEAAATTPAGSGENLLTIPALDDDTLDELSRFAALLVDANRHLNLTGITDPEGLAVRHILDSLLVADVIAREAEPGGTIMDFGSGCGVPGIPLALVLPDHPVVLVESRQRKSATLGVLAEAMGLSDRVTSVRARGEKWVADQVVDTIVTRAVGSVVDQLDLLSRKRSSFRNLIMMKGPGGDEEITAAGRRVDKLGFSPPARYSGALPGQAGVRIALVFRGARP